MTRAFFHLSLRKSSPNKLAVNLRFDTFSIDEENLPPIDIVKYISDTSSVKGLKPMVGANVTKFNVQLVAAICYSDTQSLPLGNNAPNYLVPGTGGCIKTY